MPARVLLNRVPSPIDSCILDTPATGLRPCADRGEVARRRLCAMF
jgi:hypothetical protein